MGATTLSDAITNGNIEELIESACNRVTVRAGKVGAQAAKAAHVVCRCADPTVGSRSSLLRTFF